MAFTEITDHVDRALSRLKTVFRTSAQMRGILTAVAVECQALETAILTVRNSIRNVDNGGAGNLATMVRVANLVGARALGSIATADYKVLINAQIQVNKSQGSPEDMIAVCNALIVPYLGPLNGGVLDAGEGPSAKGNMGGTGVLLIEPEISYGTSISIEFARNALALTKSATPAGGRTIVVMAITPTNNPNAIFLLDSTLTDSTARMIVALDSPSTLG